MDADTTAGQRAILHHAEQLWDATRGLRDAYRIDMARPDLSGLPAWSELCEHQQLAFILTITRATYALDSQAALIAKGSCS